MGKNGPDFCFERMSDYGNIGTAIGLGAGVAFGYFIGESVINEYYEFLQTAPRTAQLTINTLAAGGLGNASGLLGKFVGESFALFRTLLEN
jgi:hypothetical protein